MCGHFSTIAELLHKCNFFTILKHASKINLRFPIKGGIRQEIVRPWICKKNFGKCPKMVSGRTETTIFSCSSMSVVSFNPNNCDREKTSGFPLLWVCFSCNISPNLTRRWENFDFNFVLYVYKLIDCSPYIRAYAKIQNLRNLFALEAPRQLGGHAVEIIDNGLVTFTFISNHNNNFIASLSWAPHKSNTAQLISITRIWNRMKWMVNDMINPFFQ